MPTAQEVLMVELINRARLDPAAEAARYGIDLNEGLPSGTISSASKQPLAINQALFIAADGHSQAMIDGQYFAHNDPNTGSTPQSRANAAGYSGTVGENISWRGVSPGPINPTTALVQQHQDLFVDQGVDGRGHRLNILNSNYQDVGVGQVIGPFQGFSASMITQDFGRPTANILYVTGVSYNDTDNDNFYSVGEGIGGLNVSIGGSSITSAPEGNFALQTALVGAQTITLTGAGLAGAVTLAVTLTSRTNLKVDVISGNELHVSASATVTGPISVLEGLGVTGLALATTAGNQTIIGTKGNDSLSSGIGNDTLAGNLGTNTMAGGAGTDIAFYNVASNSVARTHNSDGSWTLSGQNFTDTISGVEIAQFADQTIALRTPTSSDFVPSGASDILFRNDATGDTGFYQIENGTLQQWRGLGASAPAYSVAGIGDFNGDGTSDILFRNNSSGDTGYYRVNSDGTLGGWQGIANSSTAYRVVGVGDFNGDRISDILFRNDATGDTGIYQLSSSGTLDGWRGLGASSPAYTVVGVGDFTGDGTSDILFRGTANGDIGFFAISNASNAGWHSLGGASTAYAVVGTGDYNGDGTSDILFRNNTSGDTGFYAIVGGMNTGWQGLGATSPAYSVVGSGDYNGDGTSDILFRNNNSGGDLGYFAMSNGANTGWHALGGSSTAYHVIS
jgi:hypothetical protein